MPADAAQALWQVLAPLRARHAQVRWSDPAKLHLTLVFLGSTPSTEVERLTAVLADVAARWRPFEIVTSGAGGYLGRRGGVAWLKLAAPGGAQLSRLSIEVDRAMSAGTYERMRPRPHLTIARGASAALLDELQAMPPLGISFPLARLELLRSHTDPSGSRYEPLAGFEL